MMTTATDQAASGRSGLIASRMSLLSSPSSLGEYDQMLYQDESVVRPPYLSYSSASSSFVYSYPEPRARGRGGGRARSLRLGFNIQLSMSLGGSSKHASYDSYVNPSSVLGCSLIHPPDIIIP
jgi:hypothetical protein